MQRGVYSIVGNSLTEKGNPTFYATDLAFEKWDSEVIDLDAGNSDYSSTSGRKNSVALQWQDVTFTPKTINSSSIKRIKEAVAHFAFIAVCPGDI